MKQAYLIAEASIKYESLGYTDVRDDEFHGIKVTVKAPKGATVKFGKKRGKYNLKKSPTYKKEGSYTVYFQITAPNYKTVKGKETVLILAKKESATSGPAVLTNTKHTRFRMMMPRSTKVEKNSITLGWNKVKNANRYVVYGNRCNTKGHAYYLKRLGVSKNTSFTVKDLSSEKLSKTTMYKFMVIAYDENDNIIERSSTIHIGTIKLGNYKAVKLKNPKSGKITAKGAGNCSIYVYTQNGKYKTIAVTVQ